MKTRTVLLLGCVLALSVQAATTRREMWVWKDAQGVTHYSDIPAPGAKKIEIVGTTPVPTSPPPAPAAAASPPEPKPAREYTTLEFTSPEKDAFFFGPQTEVPVTLSVAPGLMEGDELVWYLDGNRVDEATNSASYTFKNLARGTHSVVAVIRDANGEEKIRALSRSFTVRQEAMNNPRNVGPALKPKPTPQPAPTPTPPPPKSNK
jgi:membrane carboxypeptidase/penicillin-binding protein PbpC